MDARRRTIWELHDFAVGRGLEIGPLDRGIVLRGEADVAYTDILDQAGLVDHYRDDVAVDTDLIPVIDHPLTVDGDVLTLRTAVGDAPPFDWLVASHVVEHVPDLIGWLQELGDLCVDDGSLVLVVPDQRFSFDLHRAPTTVGAMIQAHDDRDLRPSLRAVYDHFSSAVIVDTGALWNRDRTSVPTPIYDADGPANMLESARSGNYVDSHVWLFTPALFVAQMRDLRRLGLSPWAVEVMHETPLHQLEFFVRLRRLPRGTNTSVETVPGEVEPDTSRPFWLDEIDSLSAEHEAAVADLERRLSQVYARLEKRTLQLRKARARISRLQARADVALDSHEWKLGNALLSPARRIRRRLPGRR